MIRFAPPNVPRSIARYLLPLLLLTSCRPPPIAVKAEQLLLKRNLTAAQGTVDAGLKIEPHSRPLWDLAIRIHLAQNQVKEAIQHYQKYIEASGPDAPRLQFLALSLLRWGLLHHNPVVRLAALQGARKTDSLALEKDVAEKLDDPDAVVRTWAAVALSGTPIGADTLGEQLHSSSDQARAIAVRALGRIAQQAALPALAPFVTDPAPGVRVALANALGLTQTERALPHLVQLLKDKDKGVRTHAASAIGAVGLKAGAAPLRALLKDHHLGVRLAALLALSRIAPEESKPQLRQIAAGADLLTGLRAGVALAKLGEVQPVLNVIAKSLVDQNQSVRVAGCNAASSVQERVAPRLVKKVLEDPEPAVRIAAARALLAHHDHQIAVDIALALSHQACAASNNEQQWLCLQAGELLSKAQHPAGIALLSRLSSEGSSVQLKLQALALALQHSKDHSLALRALMDQDPSMIMAAATWLVLQLR